MICVAAIVFLAALVRRYHWLGGPYFDFFPSTIQDHVWPARFPSADAIVLCRRVEPLLPRGAKVTVLKPAEAPNYDQTHWLTGLGLLTHQRVMPQKLDDGPQFVIAIRAPLEDPRYSLVKSFPEGGLYELKR